MFFYPKRDWDCYYSFNLKLNISCVKTQDSILIFLFYSMIPMYFLNVVIDHQRHCSKIQTIGGGCYSKNVIDGYTWMILIRILLKLCTWLAFVFKNADDI